MSSDKTIFVYWNHRSPEPELLGTLSSQCVRSKEVFSFAFEKQWLRKHPDFFQLDPDIQSYGGIQFTSKTNFGLFMDSAPDRWGRKLMMRREAIRARKANEKPRTLLESDYLLGVYDETRMGALRFKLSTSGQFLNDDSAMAAPPWARLRELEEASQKLENDSLSSEHEKWLAVLIAPGSSLGGARPKACITSPSGELWIAKFPSRKDASNTAAWEFATMKMAKDAGLNTPEIQLESFSDKGSTFLSKRFDRINGQRLHFASAMTLLGKSDGDEGSSYLDLAEFIISHCAAPEQDLLELWKRVVFSIAVSNTDDHLRNHGFLLSKNGWSLSPAYDINPNPEGTGLSLNITNDDNSLDFDLALEIAPYFRINATQANQHLNNIRQVVGNWRSYARRSGLGNSDMELMTPAFRV